jgi:hypothetical protein
MCVVGLLTSAVVLALFPCELFGMDSRALEPKIYKVWA